MRWLVLMGGAAASALVATLAAVTSVPVPRWCVVVLATAAAVLFAKLATPARVGYAGNHTRRGRVSALLDAEPGVPEGLGRALTGHVERRAPRGKPMPGGRRRDDPPPRPRGLRWRQQPQPRSVNDD